jgi:chemotaxis methyl-accepting protein methylase
MNADKSTSRTFLSSEILRRSLGAYLSQARRTWKYLSPSVRSLPLGRAYGRHLDYLVRLYADRKQYFSTFFLRNRAELELMCRLVDRSPHGSRLDISVLACSKGAEVYSIAWVIRSMRPDLQLEIHAVDISQEILNFAARGVYSLSNFGALPSLNEEIAKKKGDVCWNTWKDQNAWMFARMSKEEIDAIFDVEGDLASIRPWLRQGITWLCWDAADRRLQATIGPQDIVVANRFLCHMKPAAAQSSLRNITQLVKPGGHLFVSGIDLDVRTSVALEMGWQPVADLIREIHDGDDSIRRGWPLEYWGLEPLDESRTDWRIRYASVFQVGEKIA